jgi:glycosyltransferase involved in cell wall biosynthesis
MRVLHVISSLDPQAGGPTAAVIGLATAQVRAGMQVCILSTWRDPDALGVNDRLKASGVNVQQLGPARGPLSRYPGLGLITFGFVSQEADIVHIHGLWEQVQHDAALAARRLGRPYIFRPCGMLDPWSLAQGRWKKKLYLAWRLRKDLNRASALHFTSDTERDLCVPLLLSPPAIVEPNGLDLSEFKRLPPEGTFRSQFPRLGSRRFILFLSRLHHKKGLDLLIPAFARANLPDVALVIAGPDANGYRAEVEKMVAARGISDRVVFPGMLQGPQKIAALAEAELFLLPSYQENFGIAVIEALAAGTAVIVSDGVNIHGEITSAEVGAVVPIGGTAEQNIAVLVKTLERWFSDDSLRRAAEERARPYVWERYDWERIARRWKEHYARIRGEH